MEEVVWFLGWVVVVLALMWFHFHGAPRPLRWLMSGLSIGLYVAILLVALAAIIWSFFA
jgi:hypothetical protein